MIATIGLVIAAILTGYATILTRMLRFTNAIALSAYVTIFNLVFTGLIILTTGHFVYLKYCSWVTYLLFLASAVFGGFG